VDASAGSKPAEFRLGVVLEKARCIVATVGIDIVVPVPATGSNSLAKVLLDGLKPTIQAFKAGRVLLKGCSSLPDHSQSLEKLDLQCNAEGHVETEVLLKWGATPKAYASTSIIRLRGAIHTRCLATERESWGVVAQELQEDLAISLRTRVQLLCDEMEPEEELLSNSVAGERNWQLPQRVFAPLCTGLSVCDYMLPGEGLDEAEERFTELLDLKSAGVDLAKWIRSVEDFLSKDASKGKGQANAGQPSEGVITDAASATSGKGNSLPLLAGGIGAALVGVLAYMAT